MEQKEFQELQNELRVVAQMHRELAERMMVLAGQISRIVYEACKRSNTEMHPFFPENDYGSIVTQVNYNPNVADKRKWTSESWPRYAIRISKWVGWHVDAMELRTAFELQGKK